jgi:hypothetical protein
MEPVLFFPVSKNFKLRCHVALLLGLLFNNHNELESLIQADISPQGFDTLTPGYYRIPAILMPVKGNGTGMFPGPGGYLHRSPALHGRIGDQARKRAEIET